MKIYFVRHGQTNLNSHKLIQGRFDAPLNNVGQKQAKAAGQILKGLNKNYRAIVSSPLSRALETGYLIARKINYKEHILIESYMIERDFGQYEMTKIVDNFPKIMTPGFTEENYENDEMIKIRIKTGLDKLHNQFPNDSIIVTTHAHAIRTVYLLFDSVKYTYTNFFLGNGSIHVFNYDGNKLNLLETHINEEQ